MYKIIILLFTVILFSRCNSHKSEIIFLDNGNSSYNIFIFDNSDTLAIKAGIELNEYLKKITGNKFELISERNPDQHYIIIGNQDSIAFPEISKLNFINEDAFFIGESNGDIYLSGNDGTTKLYAVYTFLEDYLGCRYLAPNEEYIPKYSSLSLNIKNKTYEPAFAFRKAHFPAKDDKKFRYWHKLEDIDDWGMFVHTFQHLIPPEIYFNDHPEYFSLVNGNRLSDGQLCLSNQDVLDLLATNLEAEIIKQPEKQIWSVSQNDCYNYCECDDCQKMYEEYGSISGAYIHMANYLAEKFPDKQISTLAYQFTRSAPKNIKPLDNVNIMLCSIECNRSMPLADDPRSESFVKDMEDWSSLSNNIFMWDYVVQFKNFMCPFPNFHVLQPNIQFFKKHHVDMMFQQGSGGSWSDLSELKTYLIAKLLWNPNLNADSLINDFIHYYYGAAAPYIREYFDLTHSNIMKHQEDEFLNIYGFPMDYYDSYLSPELLVKYKDLMDQAESIVASEKNFLERVQRTRLAVDFAYLDIALNHPTDEISYFIDGKLNSEMVNYLERFVSLSEETNTNRINERNFLTKDYQAYVMNKIAMMQKKNLASGKEVKLLSTYSEKYPVGGVDALTDQLFGDLDFHNNWLGFEGHDMIVEIDLGESMKINQIHMNFLKAVNSWVFEPKEVIIEISTNGESFYKAGTAFGDTSDRNYLVKSIPFILPLGNIQTRYLRISAISLKKCPEWHRGYGKPSWIFIDEIIVE